MSLYKILIVDDEEEIRLGIIKKISWEEYGFEIIGDAENGQEALEKAEKLQPDIIMTDIKMPYMDGLELGKKLAENMPQTKIIVFSGCDDFEYAKQAIKFNVIEYVLKPINSIELIDILKKLKMQLDREYDEKRNTEILHKYYIESLPVIREQFLVGVIEGRIYDKDWNIKINNIGIDFELPHFIVGVIHIDNDELDEGQYSRENSLMLISVKKVADEIIKKYCKFIAFLYMDNVIVIGNLYAQENDSTFINGLNEVCKSFKRIVGLSLSIGVGSVVDMPSQISSSYKGAQNALEYRVILGNEKVIYIEDVEPDNTANLQLDDESERSLINVIKVSSKEDISKVIDNIFKNMEELVLPFNQYRIYLMEFMTALLKVIQTYNLSVSEIFGDDFNCYSYLDKFNSIKEIKENFIKKAFKINECIKRERRNSSMVLVEKAKEYIKKNYMDDEVSVEKLCSELHISQTYFSTIFKKETDMTFVNYLTEVRLEEAVKLLNTTDEKTYMIAQKVGYPEANYFSYVFKKKFNVSPSKYRKS